jgi:hypothetical protein
MYKLDPEYDCLVRPPPYVSLISRATPQPTEDYPDASPRPLNKRRIVTPSPKRQSTRKGTAWVADCSEDSDEVCSAGSDDEVEGMVIDDPPPLTRGPGERSRKMREEIEKSRKSRRAKLAKLERERGREGMIYDFPPAGPSTPIHPRSVPPESTTKRKGPSWLSSLTISLQ